MKNNKKQTECPMNENVYENCAIGNNYNVDGTNFEIPEVWNPTFQLRWNRKFIRQTYLNTLEQLWINSNTGSAEWRDIPQVEN
jgi:hypothetical protein